MKALLLLLLATVICSGVGRTLLGRFRALALSPLERFAYGTAFGLGLAAYGVLALGLLGQLAFWPITILWMALALLGATGTVNNLRDFVQWGLRGKTSPLTRRHGASSELTYSALIAPAVLLLLVLMFAFCLCACFQPPAGHEWDVLAYHLADPKVFLSLHRVTMLPSEHHSNFPFLMEMLYCVGLLYDDYPLANMLHLLMGVLTVLAVLGYCRRMFAAQTGWIAVLLLVTTPLYLWECCVAYVEVGFGLYVTLGVFAVTMVSSLTRTGDGERVIVADTQRNVREWVLLAGVSLGFALGIKYLALIPFVLLMGLMVWRRIPLRLYLGFCVLAMVIASPWYVKNIVLTHNPVYPYFFRLFPGSVNWSADRAAGYQSEQGHFGFAHGLDNPVRSGTNLLKSPWRLLTQPDRFTNNGDSTFMSLTGGVYVAFLLPIVFLRRIPRPVTDLLVLLTVQFVAWFFVAQVVRYVISLLPLAAVLSAYGMTALIRLGAGRGQRGKANELRLLPTLGTVILTGQVAFLLWGLFVLPSGAKASRDTGMMLTSLSAGDVFKNMTEPDTRSDYLLRRLDIYAAIGWINQNTVPGEGVVLYDEPRGYYLDRPYLWGNREHSAYIPYDRMRDGAQLTQWLHDNGYRYVLINLHWSPMRKPAEEPAGKELEYLRSWYVETPLPGQWRFLLADAMRRGLWAPTPGSAHGVVVLEMSGAGSNSTGGNLP